MDGHRTVFYGWRIVGVFAITQTVGCGTLCYAFAVLPHPVARDLHTSATTVTGALTMAILPRAVMAVPVGRWLDRHGRPRGDDPRRPRRGRAARRLGPDPAGSASLRLLFLGSIRTPGASLRESTVGSPTARLRPMNQTDTDIDS